MHELYAINLSVFPGLRRFATKPNENGIAYGTDWIQGRTFGVGKQNTKRPRDVFLTFPGHW